MRKKSSWTKDPQPEFVHYLGQDGEVPVSPMYFRVELEDHLNWKGIQEALIQPGIQPGLIPAQGRANTDLTPVTEDFV